MVHQMFPGKDGVRHIRTKHARQRVWPVEPDNITFVKYMRSIKYNTTGQIYKGLL